MNDYGHDIERYLSGKLTPAERNALERKALFDPFLAEALEGAEQIPTADFSKDITDLNAKLMVKKAAPAWMWPARVAAATAVLALSTFIIWSVLQPDTIQEDVATLRKQESDFITADSTATTGDEKISAVTEEQATKPVEENVASRSAGPAATTTPQPQPSTIAEPETKKQPAPVLALSEKNAKTEPPKLEIVKSDAVKAAEQAEAKVADIAERQARDDEDALSKKKEVTKDRATDKAAAPVAGVASSTASANVIHGQVTSEDGSPVEGVNVIVKGSNVGAVSDLQGNYAIATDNSNPTLVYTYLGLKSKEVAVKEGNEINVQLKPDPDQLSEVVVTGYKGNENITPIVTLAHPETGYRAFQQYLELNLRYPEEAIAKKTEGRVMIEFTVESDGTLSEFKILKGIGHGCDEELIRLIKEGPKWLPTKVGSVSVNDQAKVRLKFDLP